MRIRHRAGNGHHQESRSNMKGMDGRASYRRHGISEDGSDVEL